MRVALVNDVPMALEALRRIVMSISGAEIAWMAENGQQAVSQCQADTPDLILMDMIMPGTDGVEATRLIMQKCPCPILVVTATVKGNATRVYEALGHGALDAVNTPVLGMDGQLTGAEDLVRSIRHVERLTCACAPPPPPAATSYVGSASPPATTLPPLVAIGASTGGPQALVTILAALPRQLPCTVIIVQHLDEQFAPGFAQWLTTESGLRVRIAQCGERPAEGEVYVACTREHLVLDAGGRLRYVKQPEGHVYRPSVDVFFYSLRDNSFAAGTAVLLTGMGQDGATGMKALRGSGWVTVAQDEATSVVWGMPAAAVKLDAADHVLPIDQIGALINSQLAKTNCTIEKAN